MCQGGRRSSGLEWGRGVPATSSPTYARLALRPHRCLATAAAGNKGCLSGKGEGEGNRPQTRSHPPFFPPLRLWLPREGAERAKAGARTWIRSFSAVLSCDTTRSIPRGGARSRRHPGCQRRGGLFLLPQHPRHQSAPRPLLLWAPFPVPAPPGRPRRQHGSKPD